MLAERELTAKLLQVVLGQVAGRRALLVLDADRVDSLPLVRGRLVRLEDVAQVGPAVVAADFGAATHADESVSSSVTHGVAPVFHRHRAALQKEEAAASAMQLTG